MFDRFLWFLFLIVLLRSSIWGQGIERDPPIDTVLETGIGPRLLELCQVDESPQLQFEILGLSYPNG